MRGAIFKSPGVVAIETLQAPEVTAPDDVLIQVEACGICGSDLGILAVPPRHPARPGVVLGHEICGRIVDAGPLATLATGDLVVIDPDIKCGHCIACDNARPSLCRHLIAMGIDEDGGFAEYCKVPTRSVFPIDESVPPVLATLVEPLAGVLHGIRSLNAKFGESGSSSEPGQSAACSRRCSSRAASAPCGRSNRSKRAEIWRLSSVRAAPQGRCGITLS